MCEPEGLGRLFPEEGGGTMQWQLLRVALRPGGQGLQVHKYIITITNTAHALLGGFAVCTVTDDAIAKLYVT